MVSLVKSLISRGCITIDQNSNITNLIRRLNFNSVGCLVVLSKEISTPIGMVSERDLIRNYNNIINNRYKKVSQIMTKKIISCSLKTTSKELMEIMTSYKIRHIPIIDQGNLLGIVSIGDVVNRLIKNYAAETKLLREFINS